MEHWMRPGAPYARDVTDYWASEGLARWIEAGDRKPTYSAYFGVARDLPTAYAPDLDDLVRLHRLLRSRRAMTVLELGVGYSTIVIADALDKNRREYEALASPPEIRNTQKWLVHSVDANREWIERARARLPKELEPRVRVTHSEVHAGTFDGQICHFFDVLPNVTPDFVYLDGPAASDVHGAVRGVDFAVPERTVMSGDLLALEPLLLPGCMVLVDGRTNNARFLRNNFRRRWTYRHDASGDVSSFELREPPLGSLNRAQIEYCLGAAWLDAVGEAEDGATS